MSNYTSIAKVKAFLDITDTSRDAKFTALLPAVDKFIDSYTGRQFLQLTITDEDVEIEADDVKIILPKQFPIITVTKVEVGGVVLAISDYFVYSWGIKKAAGYWSSMPKAIKITYTAGYSSVPADIEQAATELVAILAQEKTKTFTTNEGVEQTVLITSMPTYVKDILNAYIYTSIK